MLWVKHKVLDSIINTTLLLTALLFTTVILFHEMFLQDLSHERDLMLTWSYKINLVLFFVCSFSFKLLVWATKPYAVHQLKLLCLDHSRIDCMCVCVCSQSCHSIDKGGHDCCLLLRLGYVCEYLSAFVREYTNMAVCVSVCLICISRVNVKRRPWLVAVFGMENKMNG